MANRVVTRVKLANGSVINVRKDELAKYLAANAGAAAVSVEVAVEEVVASVAPPAVEKKVTTPRGPSSARA